MSRALILTLLSFSLFACNNSGEQPVPTTYSTVRPEGTVVPLVLAVHPLYNPRRLEAVYGPLISQLSASTGRPFRLEASRSYAAFEEKLAHREFEFALPNPYQTLHAREYGYTVFAKEADDSRFRGLFLARKGDGPTTLEEVRGKKVAFPAPTALAAAMLPQLFLARAGLKAGRDYEPVYVGSQESSIMSVATGDVALGVTWPPPWEALTAERPELATQLEVRWETASLVNNSVMARDDVDPALVAQVRDALLAFSPDHPGPERRFVAADDATYEPVMVFLEAYTHEVGPPP